MSTCRFISASNNLDGLRKIKMCMCWGRNKMVEGVLMKSLKPRGKYPYKDVHKGVWGLPFCYVYCQTYCDGLCCHTRVGGVAKQ